MEHMNSTTTTKPAENEILLEARGISKGFPGVWENLILDRIDFDVRAGEVHTLLGENGAGKTVIANILSGYYGKTAGEIRIKGRTIELQSPREGLQHGIAMVHQELMLVPAFTVAENVMMGLSYISNKDIKEKAVSALEKVGLKDRMKHKPVEMSGGEQQRVSIARALVKNPRIVLADEPTGALDTKTGSEIMEILTNLNIESKITVLIVTHEPDIAKQTKRIISFRDGEIINDERNK